MRAPAARAYALHNVSPRRPGLLKKIQRDWMLIVLALLPVTVLFVFAYVPMFGSLYSFQEVGVRSTFLDNEWVGLQWFEEFVTGIYFWRCIRNTLLLNLYSLIFGTVATIFLALTINEVRDGKFKRIMQSCTYFPNFISITVVITIMGAFLNPRSGVLSGFFESTFGWEPVDLFSEPNAFRPMYVISGIWQGTGWGAIIYLGAINGVDPGLFEAATLDGAGRLQRIWHIILPAIKPVVITLLILSVGQMMNLGAQKVLLMYRPATYEVADIISTFVHRYGILKGEYGYSTAVGFFNSIVNIIILLTVNHISKKLTDVSIF